MSDTNLNNDYYGNISNNYSASLSNEIAILQRKIYLPLLPLERITDMVLTAYRNNGRYYWFKDDVFKAEVGNFYVSMIAPLVKNGDSTDILYDAPQIKTTDGEFPSSEYKTRNYVKLTIPRHIVLQFSNLIPKGTKFNVTFEGGNSSNYSMKITSVAETVDIPDGEWDDKLYETNGMDIIALTKLVESNLKRIEIEENRRREEEQKYAKLEEGR